MSGDDETVPGIDTGGVTSWFRRHVPGVEPPLSFRLIAGGRSNLTFEVGDAAGGRWVLRRPPLGHVLATAHDMQREHRIITALGPTPVPVPRTIGLCTDDTVNGAPFYVMSYVDGRVIRDATEARALSVDARANAAGSLVDVLAAIHAVDPDQVGLGDLGRREGYIARQLKRWHGQFEQSKTREIPLVDEVHADLSARIPEQGPPAIAHGDYRLDNCLVGDDGRVLAVLDWELCTLGDPLADVGLLLVYWAEAGDAHPALLEAPTAVEGFGGRDTVLARYAHASGRDVSGVGFYVAFGYWKLACILEGVYSRYRAGVMGDADAAVVDGFGAQVERLARRAAEEAGRDVAAEPASGRKW